MQKSQLSYKRYSSRVIEYGDAGTGTHFHIREGPQATLDL